MGEGHGGYRKPLLRDFHVRLRVGRDCVELDERVCRYRTHTAGKNRVEQVDALLICAAKLIQPRLIRGRLFADAPFRDATGDDRKRDRLIQRVYFTLFRGHLLPQGVKAEEVPSTTVLTVG